MSAFRHRRYGILFLLLAGTLGISIPAAASLTYSNPFHPEQCGLAIAAAQRALAANGRDARARERLAEGLLCRGLTEDDPWALAAAAGAFDEVLSVVADNFFARLYLAEALRRRFPLAAAVVGAFEGAAAVLAHADAGAARPDLEAHIRESLAGVRAYQRQFLPLLNQRLSEDAADTLSAERVGELVTLLAQTGPAGAERALATLDAHVARQYDPALASFYRAEVLRGRAPPAVVAARYRAASAVLCEGVGAAVSECSRARWRLEQIEPLVSTKRGGMP